MSIIAEALRQLGRRPSTVKYPVDRAPIPQGFRGMPKWDMTKCILCVLCQNACPTGAIKLMGKGQEAELDYFMDRCVFCEECAETCPKRAIVMSGQFELAGFARSTMAFRFRKEKLPEQPKAAP